MEPKALILVAFAGAIFVTARTRRTAKPQPAWAVQLRGWHKIFGLVALALALVIMLNPEFLALGLVGDAAFFDVLVLLLSLQLKGLLLQAWSYFRNLFERVVPRMIARLSMSPAMALLILMPLVDLAMFVRKAAHDIFS
jgi:hypothetical protein